MLAELRSKSQITIPKKIIERLGLAEGDKLEIYEKDGIICILPIVVYSKKYIDKLKEEIKKNKNKSSFRGTWSFWKHRYVICKTGWKIMVYQFTFMRRFQKNEPVRKSQNWGKIYQG